MANGVQWWPMGSNGVQWGPMGSNGVPLRHTHSTPRVTLPLGLLWPPVASCGSIGPIVVLMNPAVVPKACVPEYSVGSFVPPGEGTAWVVF